MQKIINLLFPPKCIFCGINLRINSSIDICDACYKKIPFFNESPKVFKNSYINKAIFDDVICLCEYTGIIKESIIRYKFFNKSNYYRTFAKLLSEKVKEMTIYAIFDIIISVPLFREKEYSRGYNQSYLISKELSKQIGIKEGSGLLKRVRNTEPQSLLAKNERSRNIKDAFKVKNANKIKDKNILLVDDIFTTGSTIDECSRVLKASGAKRVVAAVIASGRKY